VGLSTAQINEDGALVPHGLDGRRGRLGVAEVTGQAQAKEAEGAGLEKIAAIDAIAVVTKHHGACLLGLREFTAVAQPGPGDQWLNTNSRTFINDQSTSSRPAVRSAACAT